MVEKESIIIVYFILVNVVAFFLMGEDKRRARKKLWRISEKTLFLAALLGGSVGGLCGMYYFRHKTKHWYFRIGFPVIVCVQMVLVMLVGDWI